MTQLLDVAVPDIGEFKDVAIKSHGSPDKVRFMDIATAEGLQAAQAWRAQRFEAE
ncbi:MAG: hypothetical protein HUU30_11655 [Burkholderiaceae bacterium]|nr:hypothetical protein [Burkholderiaceae bacterium]